MNRLVLVLGILLLVRESSVSLILLHYHKKEDVAKIGPLSATVNEEKSVEIRWHSPSALVTGIGLTVFGMRAIVTRPSRTTHLSFRAERGTSFLSTCLT